MKKVLQISLICAALPIVAQLQVNTIDLTTNDLVYNPSTHKIYASIPSANGSNGNSIGVINPDSNLLETTVFIGSEPSVMAISDNGQYIYSGFSATSTVRRFDIATLSAGPTFTLGSDPSTGPFYVEDIEVMPGNPNTIAVARRNMGYSPRHEGVAIYDNGIMRSTTTPDHTGSNRIEFTSQNSLIGYNNETTEFGIRRMSVNAAGVTTLGVSQSVLNAFYLDFIYYDNKMFASNGQVVDITTTPYMSGQFANVSGPAAYDTYLNRVAYASFDYSGNIIFKRFNPNTYLLVDSLPISQAFGNVKSHITCGPGCYAFNTNGNKVVIIKDLSLSTKETDTMNKVSIFPNPTSDFIYIEGKDQIEKVLVTDIAGREILRFNSTVSKIDLRSVNPGNYLLKLIDKRGKIITKKIIKR